MNRDFEKMISEYPENIQFLAIKTRERIYSMVPKVVEIPWPKQKVIGYGTGPKRDSEHFCYIVLAKDHITLGFNYGAELPDPHKILQGDGKLFRNVKLKKTEELEDKRLLEILKYATTYRVPQIE